MRRPRYMRYRDAHGQSRMPERGYGVGISGQHYDSYYRDLDHARHAAQLLADEELDRVDLVQIQNRGNTRFIIDEFEPKVWR